MPIFGARRPQIYVPSGVVVPAPFYYTKLDNTQVNGPYNVNETGLSSDSFVGSTVSMNAPGQDGTGRYAKTIQSTSSYVTLFDAGEAIANGWYGFAKFTIAFWFKQGTGVNSTFAQFVSWSSSVSGGERQFLITSASSNNSNPDLDFRPMGDSNNQLLNNDAVISNLSTVNWEHIAMVFDSSQPTNPVTVYRDGVVASQGTWNTGNGYGQGSTMNSNTTNMGNCFVARREPWNSNRTVDASFDTVLLYAHALTQAQIQQVMAGNVGYP